MKAGQVVAWNIHQQVMLHVIIDPVGSHAGTPDQVGLRCSRMPEGIIIVRNDSMFGDVTDTRDQGEPDEEGQRPQQEEQVPVSGERKDEEQAEIDRDGAAKAGETLDRKSVV